ncbi:carboxypeptidase regulatory-like domain-containing protein [Terrimonas sp. NA20]|uniref:Carboxypeptidase regulatory-like domain-containing protein n=1 Tax=Terrimonas ginsenosidimutans TaxID=2908004 RepID=A0ABS9KXH7_9BACT|nr:carboxypeptidase regulatory-like domain-containing protein [Terrimonas ginsenosidimutans]MCG2617026.1 carboxypeptidase regulatory-like domain-containing protein [Terrimonas ginsenosidimutans]
MKKARLTLAAIAISAASLFSFKAFEGGSVKGTVTPADKAIRAWAISSTDTVRADISSGAFEIKDVKPGTYSVIIEAQEPFANTRKKDVVVTEGQATEVGEIQLQPKN